ncbi:MAG: anti-sigma factor domain-containing protein [Acidimicrobiales bacterium]
MPDGGRRPGPAGGPHLDVAGYLLGTLDPYEAASFEQHRVTCARCRAEFDELDWVPARLADARPAPEPPAALLAQTLAAVGQDARDRRTRPGRRWPLAVVAATVVTVAAVAALTAAPSSPSPPPHTVELVSAPGAGTGAGATAARGVARLQRGPFGVVIALQLQNLAPPPPGSFYECWYLAASDTAVSPARVSAGSFTTPAGGRALVRMVTAADPARYPAIQITLEPDDGNPARTGTVVLQSRPRK